MLIAGGERVAELRLTLDRVGRRRVTASEFARAVTDFLKALELWCAEIELAGVERSSGRAARRPGGCWTTSSDRRGCGASLWHEARSRSLDVERGLAHAGRVIVVGATGAALLGLGYIAMTWYRYGRSKPSGPSDPLARPFHAELRSCGAARDRSTRVGTGHLGSCPALDLRRSPLVRAIFSGRELLMRATPVTSAKSRTLLEEVRELGWGILAEEPGRSWSWARDAAVGGQCEFRSLPADAFAAYREPGYVKIVWTLAVEPAGRSTPSSGRRPGWRRPTPVATSAFGGTGLSFHRASC